jgi:hypothetical protein
MWATLGFFVGLIVIRIVTTVLHYQGAGPNGGIIIHGVHVHHFVFGIVLLLLIGYLWLLLFAIDPEARKPFRATAVGYGVAGALILDEFALWLNLRDVYWERQGRESFEVLAIFGGFLLFALLIAPYVEAVARHFFQPHR